MQPLRWFLFVVLLAVPLHSLAQLQPMFRLPPGDRLFYVGLDAYEDGDFETAERYFRDAAAWANKPAQFNMGVMHLHGQGVVQNPVEAYAWFALAAERITDPRMREARDSTLEQLDPEQSERARVREQELIAEYGDDRRLQRVARWFRKEKRQVTGSRVGFTGSALTIYAKNATGNWTWYGRTEYMKARAQWLGQWEEQYLPEGYVEFGDLELLDDEPAGDDASPQRR